jgi:hypothetical protein
MKKADNFDAGKWLVENKITTQSRLNEGLESISRQLKKAGFNFEDGILMGGGSSQSGGYYDAVSDEISGYNLDEFNEDKFNKWYDSFTLDNFTSMEYNEKIMKAYRIDRAQISEIPSGFYAVGKYGFAQIKDNGDLILYATPALTDNGGDAFYAIFGIDGQGNIVKKMSKEKASTYLKQNIEKKSSWSIV